MSNSSSSSSAIGICVALLGLLLFVLSLRVGSFVQQQNANFESNIQGMKQTLERGQRMQQDIVTLRNTLLQYVNQTRDANVLVLLNRYGLVQIQQSPAGQTQAKPATPPAK